MPDRPCAMPRGSRLNLAPGMAPRPFEKFELFSELEPRYGIEP